MASSLSNLKTPLYFQSFKNPFSFRSCSRFIPSFSYHSSNPRLFHSASAAASDSSADNLLQKPLLSQEKGIAEEQSSCYDEQEEQNDNSEKDMWIDWEDRILEHTVPLVGFVRKILHSGIYENGDKLSPEHEETIIEKLLPFHPESQKKIGDGIDYITIGNHPDFENSRCLFIVRKDGEMVDFSFWKCIKGLIRTNYPLYADSFILRHFRNRSRSFSS